MNKEKSHKRHIILFYPAGLNYLKKMVFKDIDFRLFNPETDINYFSLRNVFKAFYTLIKKDLCNSHGEFISFNSIRELVRCFRARLIIEQLKKMAPSVVLTFTDNSTVFHMVSKFYQEVKFLAIQNGGRYVWCATDALPNLYTKYHIDEYFCFGEQTKNLFQKHNHKIKRYIKSGSLVGGYYFSQHLINHKNETFKYDICFVSQWSEDISEGKNLPFAWRNLETSIIQLTELVSQYLKNKKLKFCIALRSNKEIEKKFYEQYFDDDNCSYIRCKREEYTSYKAMTQSNLIIALNSTLASEGFGAKLKVLFVNPLSEAWLKPTENDGPWYLPLADSTNFKERVDFLLSMSSLEFINEAKSEMEEVMAYNFTHPAHLLIRERLLELSS